MNEILTKKGFTIWLFSIMLLVLVVNKVLLLWWRLYSAMIYALTLKVFIKSYTLRLSVYSVKCLLVCWSAKEVLETIFKFWYKNNIDWICIYSSWEYFMFSQEKSNVIWLIWTIFALAKATMTPIITNKHKTFVFFASLLSLSTSFLFTPFLLSNLNWKKWESNDLLFWYLWSNCCLSNFEGFFGR